uniref:DUS-like FMN-binding domain-containing protein n=1 Tax=Bartheletia paradoxa TaxID=669517 RepID=A0A2D0XHP1_9BASI|nr:hypothetical protein SPAR06872 [Bartheletia paradoxa]
MAVLDHARSRSCSPDPSEPALKRTRVSVSSTLEPVLSTGTAEPSSALTSAQPERLIDYRNSVVLAPMVRSGTLPTRLVSLRYGADLVWGPEIVAQAIIGTTRVVDPVTGVIDYRKNNRSIWSTHPIERPYMVFQLGASDPVLAAEAALTVAQDIVAIDLNCGCPKPFSISGGMGAALLSKPDVLCSILTALVAALPTKSVSAKIRLLPEDEPTMDLVRQIAGTGIKALTVHCRTRDMRSTETALWHRLVAIREEIEGMGIPVICNGDGQGRNDLEKIRGITSASSIMVARAAEANPSVFRAEGPLDIETDVAPFYVRTALVLDNFFQNTKFCLGSMNIHSLKHYSPPGPPLQLREATAELKERRKNLKIATSKSKNYEMLAEVWGIDAEATRREGIEGVLGGLREELQIREARRIEETKSGLGRVGIDKVVEQVEAIGEPLGPAPDLEESTTELMAESVTAAVEV